MHYEGTIIRPPSEADSILLQVSAGCSRNACAFCGAYVGQRFAVIPEGRVFEDIDWAAARLGGNRRLFLCGGDALTLPMERLERVFARVRERLPRVGRVGAYASALGLEGKSRDDLARLASLGLDTVYMGLESGDDAVLEAMNKGSTAGEILAAGRMVMDAGLRLSVTVITGLGGLEGSERHARLTGEALAALSPHHAAALTLIPVPGTPLWRRIREGRFVLPEGPEMVRELRALLEHAHMERGLFLADHASNHVPLRLRMPRDREAGLALLDEALAGRRGLKPESARRL
ncbi:hypothetical protein NNJEOMEG_02641 [Fundidesulfovibrio magnetotacticus]|uniref:Radical SAM core domain-containing protein n=1 Tax=Fundidesulfovibrio magnetotacticus TaxID=2730080 RepID=A0A6V8LQM1_9BACT|nr:radical SAM protein [Fundidesulfovibrio magnetotacticus]GFK94793.1 hypothetical protein NNJEOMEG_02641 [Fundidesulfovibrio magnetotacticus]